MTHTGQGDDMSFDWFRRNRKARSLVEEFSDIVAGIELTVEEVVAMTAKNRAFFVDGPVGGKTLDTFGGVRDPIIFQAASPEEEARYGYRECHYHPVLDAMKLPRRDDDGRVLYRFCGGH